MTLHHYRVSLVGLGYVGLCTAVTFASRDIDTLGIEVDWSKRSRIAAGDTPFHEPELDSFLKRALQTNRLNVTGDVSAAAASDVIFITVGTPSQPDGSMNVRYVEEAAKQIGMALRDEQDYRLLVVKSTVTPGTTRSIVKPALEESCGRKVGDELGLCMNPEFLREGSAIPDALHPDKLVIGAIDEESASRLEGLYRAFYGGGLPPMIVTTPETAELVKYASNAFLATKISFINTVANIAQQIPGVDVERVAQTIGLDPRIGPLFLKAGPGYGGSCFHKDVQALIAFSRDRGYDPRLLRTVEETNEEQAEKVVELSERLTGSLKDKRIAVLGVAFKKDTDDIREAASLRVIDQLKKRGADVVVNDPMAIPNARTVLENRVEFAANPMSAIEAADCCIILTEWDEFRELTGADFVAHMRRPNVVDARRLYRPEQLEGVNLMAVGLGPEDSNSERPEGEASRSRAVKNDSRLSISGRKT